MRSKTLTTSVSMMEYLYELVCEIAKEQGVSKSEVIRTALDKYTQILAKVIDRIGPVQGGTLSVCVRQNDEAIHNALARLGIRKDTKVSRSRIISDAVAFYVGQYMSEKGQTLTVDDVLQLPASQLKEQDRFCHGCGISAAYSKAQKQNGTWILKDGFLYCPTCTKALSDPKADS